MDRTWAVPVATPAKVSFLLLRLWVVKVMLTHEKGSHRVQTKTSSTGGTKELA
jgi:hypothetical protein